MKDEWFVAYWSDPLAYHGTFDNSGHFVYTAKELDVEKMAGGVSNVEGPFDSFETACYRAFERI